MITWRYPEEIRERLVKPHQYTRVLLEISGQMRSYPAAVLYEIGARYLTSPSRLSMREDVLWWAAVLTGRSDITEVDYRFLKRDVISKALAEIEALCEDFSLELIEHKRGRRIEEIQFRVVPKLQQRLGAADDPSRNVFDLELVGKLIALGLKQDEAQDLYATTDEGQLRGTLEHVEQRLRSQTLPALKSPAAYFKDALKKGYAGVRGAVARRAGRPAFAVPGTPRGRARRRGSHASDPGAVGERSHAEGQIALPGNARSHAGRDALALRGRSARPRSPRPSPGHGGATGRPAGSRAPPSIDGWPRSPGRRNLPTGCCWILRWHRASPACDRGGDGGNDLRVSLHVPPGSSRGSVLAHKRQSAARC